MSALIPTFLGSFASNALANAAVANPGWIPSNPGSTGRSTNVQAGLVYFNTATGLLRMHNGSVWQELSATGGGNVGPDENITSNAVAGTTVADLDYHVHLITTPGNSGFSFVTIPDGTTDGERHKFTVEALGDNADRLDVFMTLYGAYDRIRFDNPADVFDGFEVVWDGSNWWPMWRESCAPYFNPV